jgi:hypothetical protein
MAFLIPPIVSNNHKRLLERLSPKKKGTVEAASSVLRNKTETGVNGKRRNNNN